MKQTSKKKRNQNRETQKNLPCQKNDRVVISIEDIGSGGEGIGFLMPAQEEGTGEAAMTGASDPLASFAGTSDSLTSASAGSRKKRFPVFVKDAVPGDTIEAVITKVTARYAYGHLDRVLQPSPFRVMPPCPIARTCGGCQIQALDYAKQLEFKQKKVREDLIRIGGFAPETVDSVMHPIVGMEEPWHYRNKEQVPVQQGKYGPVTGFYASHSHTVIPMTDCSIGSPHNRRILETVLSWMQAHGVPAYDETTGRGLIRHILIRDGIYSGRIMVCIIANDYRIPFEKELTDALRGLVFPAPKKITSIVLNTNTDRTNVITGRTLRTLWGNDDIEDTLHIYQCDPGCDRETGTVSHCSDETTFRKTEESVTFAISPLSFYQVNPRQTEKLYSLALACAGLTGRETVWDLYCSVGTISLFMARHAKEVCGIEIIPEAIENAKKNAKRNGITNARFYVGKAEEVLPDYVEKLKAEGKDPQIDVICVDPPRKGCDEKCIETMLEIGPERIVYVSCDPATLARDLKKLAAGGYELDYVQPVDQFGHTVHVETCCSMVLKDQ